MGHIRLKPSKQFDINFHPSELDNIQVPLESQKKAKEYISSKKLSEDDILLMFEDKGHLWIRLFS